MAVQVQAGDGFSLSTGDFPMTWSLSLLSSFLHIIQLYLVDLNIFFSLTIFSSLTIQNLVRILLAVERTPRCPLLWIVHYIDVKIDDHKEEGELYFCCDSSQSTFLPVLQPRIFHLYSFGDTAFVSSLFNVFIDAFLRFHNPEFFCLCYISWS